MYDMRTREIQEAIEAADVALDHLERAKRCLSSASGWGLFDTLGGGFISGLIKHSKMSDAEPEPSVSAPLRNTLPLSPGISPRDFLP